jgi:hypothetical protein
MEGCELAGVEFTGGGVAEVEVETGWGALTVGFEEEGSSYFRVREPMEAVACSTLSFRMREGVAALPMRDGSDGLGDENEGCLCPFLLLSATGCLIVVSTVDDEDATGEG